MVLLKYTTVENIYADQKRNLNLSFDDGSIIIHHVSYASWYLYLLIFLQHKAIVKMCIT